MSYGISFYEAFIVDLTRVPRRVQNTFRRTLEFLTEHAEDAGGNKVKKLHGYRDLWRCRVGDSYRLIYRVTKDRDRGTVTLVALGDRKDIYDRIGLGPDGPTHEIIREAPELIEEQTTEHTAAAWLMPAVAEDDHAASPDDELPIELTPELLSEWSIPRAHHAALCSSRTEQDLLALSGTVDDSILLRVMNLVWPPALPEIVQTPTRVARSAEELLEAVDESRSLGSFLLKLDEDQEAFVRRFHRIEPKGPWMLKGGPGSGKSVVALYCIREIVAEHEASLPGLRGQMKILLTTYTNSLIKASKRLLTELVAGGSTADIQVETIDRIAARLAGRNGFSLNPVNDSHNGVKSASQRALEKLRSRDASFPFDRRDVPFLLEEVDWVIAGRGIDSLDGYLEEDRTGRGRGLNERQRRGVWQFHELLTPALESQKLCFFSTKQAAALDGAAPQYDYVFIDEAQDLKPVAIRLASKLCKGGKNVFITADSNQSIYGTGMRWRAVADELQFTGRTSILKRNYRTTREIWEAVAQLAPDDDATDSETMAVEPVYRGRWPTIHWYGDVDDWAPALNRFIAQAMREERVGPDSVAVLCPTTKEFDDVVAAVDSRYNAKAMRSRNLDIAHPGVKVTTMHAAKGIEFPIVVVAAAEDGRLPWYSMGTEDTEHLQRQQRLLFVACTRAMRRLLILASADERSPFLENVTDDLWEMDGTVPT
ncbi:MAG: AAA family ATPase [bacterium]|nr:AAA family ATPase [bacterium]